jgi:hypothetical protein
LSRVLAGKSDELVALAALWNLDAVLVEPLLDLAVTPAVEELLAERLLGRVGGCRSRGSCGSGVVGCDTGVAAERGDELVTVGWLWGWDTTLIEPGLDVRLGPPFIEPVAWVSSSLADLVGNSLIVRADGLKERVAGAWSWVRDTVAVKELLELGLSPAGLY